ncbi:hypothetical protein [Bullifex porci]|uniref:hypothetical protein n=1 Tax=Bullifex porci TaxID=2606638 RepID=UPI0023EFCC5A|nr:hypothetical protein [Bullifex porci]MDD7589044.1 hypothetical protein [Bullifex porci]
MAKDFEGKVRQVCDLNINASASNEDRFSMQSFERGSEKRKFENLMMQVINGTMSVDAAATKAMMSVDEFLRYKEEFLKRFK